MLFEVQERMLGTKEPFPYFECANCGCLQLVAVPPDLGRYYPSDTYYAYRGSDAEAIPTKAVRRWIKRKRDAAILFDGCGWAAALSTRVPNPGIEDLRRWLEPTAIRSFQSRILDVGCGSGALLARLAQLGFTDLTGIDPFAPEPTSDSRYRIIVDRLSNLTDERFDLIMFHHSLEHMPNQQELFADVRRLLSPTGVCLIRIPIKSQGPWKRYQTEWAEIDAPRHLFLHTELSLSIAAGGSGLSISQVSYEDEPFAYLASELYHRDGALVDLQSPAGINWSGALSDEEIDHCQNLSRTYNVPGWASRAAFWLRPQDQVPYLPCKLVTTSTASNP